MDKILSGAEANLGVSVKNRGDEEAGIGAFGAVSGGLRIPVSDDTGVHAPVVNGDAFVLLAGGPELALGGKFGFGTKRTHASLLVACSFDARNGGATPTVGVEVAPFGWQIASTDTVTGPLFTFLNEPGGDSTAVYAGWRVGI